MIRINLYALMGWFLIFGMVSCGGKKTVSTDSIRIEETDGIEKATAINSEGRTVKTRYNVPPKFYRVETERGSFPEYLQNLSLKPYGYVTHTADGLEKAEKISTSVVDIDSTAGYDAVGAIIRLRGEYLFNRGEYAKLAFHLNKTFVCDFITWAKGKRIEKRGNKLRWKREKESNDFSYGNFIDYISTVCTLANKRALESDMRLIPENEFGIGTVIISDDSEQHVMMVVDMIQMDKGISINGWRDMKAVLLVQGGDPSQEIEIIKGDYDEFSLFPRNEGYAHYWNTTNYGERFIDKQGGLLMTGDRSFYNKKLYRFKNDTINLEKQ